MEKRFISIIELSQYIGVPAKTIRSWVWQRQIPYRKFGRLVRFDIHEIEKWSAEKTTEVVK